MVLVQVRMQRYLYIVSPIRKFKHPIRTIEYYLHIEISLETKFFIFLEFFLLFFPDILKMVILDGYKVIRLTNLSSLLKIVKNFKKNVKFGLQGDFNI